MSDMVIRGIEIPKTGSRVIEINSRGEVFELFKTDGNRGGFLKSRKLEAVELPEPHGRCIDADFIKNKTQSWTIGREDDYYRLVINANAITKAILDFAPTVLEASE